MIWLAVVFFAQPVSGCGAFGFYPSCMPSQVYPVIEQRRTLKEYPTLAECERGLRAALPLLGLTQGQCEARQIVPVKVTE